MDTHFVLLLVFLSVLLMMNQMSLVHLLFLFHIYFKKSKNKHTNIDKLLFYVNLIRDDSHLLLRIMCDPSSSRSDFYI